MANVQNLRPTPLDKLPIPVKIIGAVATALTNDKSDSSKMRLVTIGASNYNEKVT